MSATSLNCRLRSSASGRLSNCASTLSSVGLSASAIWRSVISLSAVCRSARSSSTAARFVANSDSDGNAPNCSLRPSIVFCNGALPSSSSGSPARSCLSSSSCVWRD